MNDKSAPPEPVGSQLRRLRTERGMTLAELARLAGTSAPTLHRYESGWDRFEIRTLRKLAAALGARLEVRLDAPSMRASAFRRPSGRLLATSLRPLFWDRPLRERDLARHAGWVIERVLTAGTLAQVRAARAYFGEDAIRSAAQRRGVDPRTRAYWRLLLGGIGDASEGPRR
jgi:transcriptional regulator with XRE-family HTH domain